MASRLSEESVLNLYDRGQLGLSRTKESVKAPLPWIDLTPLLEGPEPKKQIRALAPQTLYHSLKKRGLEDSLDAIALMSPDQLRRIFDYDVWHDGEINHHQVFRWLALIGNLGPKSIGKRFRQLDEEYQLAIVAPFIRCYTPDEYETMSPEQQDSLNALPAQALYYAIVTEDKEIYEGVDSVIQSCMASDMEFTMSLLWHSAYALPHEAEASLVQFRQARLEEDGFLTDHESLQLFDPIDIDVVVDRLRAKSAARVGGATAVTGDKRPTLFLDAVITEMSDAARLALQQGFLYLANALCTATKIEVDDTEGLQVLMDHARGLSSLGLEFLSQGEITRALGLLETESPRTLFPVGLGLIHDLRLTLIAGLENAKLPQIERVKRYTLLNKTGLAIATLEQVLLPILGLQRTEMVKALFSRLPVYPYEIKGTIAFSPIRNLRDYSIAAHLTAGVIGQFELAVLAGATFGEKPIDLERWLLTTIGERSAEFERNLEALEKRPGWGDACYRFLVPGVESVAYFKRVKEEVRILLASKEL